MDQLANDYSTQPLVIVEYGSSFRPPSRTAILKENGGGSYVPEMMIDSGHEWQTGVDYPSAKGFADRSMARPVGANVQAVYERTGNMVNFLVTITNNSGETLSKANNAAVHAIIYEDKPGVHKTSRIGRADGKADIGFLQNGKTDSFFMSLDGSKVTDWTKAHFIVMVDYKPAASKDAGVYDQLQAAIATPGTATPPTVFKLVPESFTYSFNDREQNLPSGEFTITLPTDKTWTAETNVDWLSIDKTDGGNGETIKFTITTKEHFTYGKNHGLVIVTESGGGRQRAALIEVNYSKAPEPVFKVLPVSITKTIKHSDPPGPEVGVRISGDVGQTWTAESEQDWIIMTPASGSVPATFIVTFDRTKLVDGLNEGKITVRDGDDFHEKTVTVNITYIAEGGEEPEVVKIFFPLIVNAE